MSEAATTTAQTPERRPHAEGGEHGEHPTEGFYVLVAVILAGVTAIEVGLSYWHIIYMTNILLLILAAVKFSMVAMFFMHLRFDNRVFRRFFITGIILAISVYIIVMLTLGVFVKA